MSKKIAVAFLAVLAAIVLTTAASCSFPINETSSSAPETVSPDAVLEVSDSQPEVIPVDVSVSDTKMVIGVRTAHTISAKGGESITWRSSDESVATIDSDGSVTAIKPGSCRLTAENEFGRTAECRLTVKRTVYITIDDGPLKYCEEILDSLKRNKIKATFFVVKTYNVDMLKRMHSDGHYVGLHTYNHNFSKCYRSDYSYYADLEKLKDYLEKNIGERPDVIRFPGGASNQRMNKLGMRRMISGLDDLGYRAFDWTSSAGDSSSTPITYKEAASNTLYNCCHDVDIVLMHDKETTAKALDIIVPELRRRGYLFETLDHSSDQSMIMPSWYEKTVSKKAIPCSEVTVSTQERELKKGKSFTLEAAMKPSDCTDYLRFVSDDPSIAKVTLEGVVTGKKAGTVEIKAIASSGAQAVCTVTVTVQSESDDFSQ